MPPFSHRTVSSLSPLSLSHPAPLFPWHIPPPSRRRSLSPIQLFTGPLHPLCRSCQPSPSPSIDPRSVRHEQRRKYQPVRRPSLTVVNETETEKQERRRRGEYNRATEPERGEREESRVQTSGEGGRKSEGLPEGGRAPAVYWIVETGDHLYARREVRSNSRRDTLVFGCAGKKRREGKKEWEARAVR